MGVFLAGATVYPIMLRPTTNYLSPSQDIVSKHMPSPSIKTSNANQGIIASNI